MAARLCSCSDSVGPIPRYAPTMQWPSAELKRHTRITGTDRADEINGRLHEQSVDCDRAYALFSSRHRMWSPEACTLSFSTVYSRTSPIWCMRSLRDVFIKITSRPHVCSFVRHFGPWFSHFGRACVTPCVTFGVKPSQIAFYAWFFTCIQFKVSVPIRFPHI